MNQTERIIGSEILRKLPYEPNSQQMEIIAALSKFVADTDDRSVFLLNGYAGTGKTSLAGALVAALPALRRQAVLLAPTGRAAKVFAAYSRHSAFTIHRKIYQSRRYNPEDSHFCLARNNHKNTLFIVDEASMIANNASEGAVFGTGCLLDDLITYVYSGEGCRLILLGDVAQLHRWATPTARLSRLPRCRATPLRSTASR